jgi:hypothetical protein
MEIGPEGKGPVFLFRWVLRNGKRDKIKAGQARIVYLPYVTPLLRSDRGKGAF